MTNEAIQPYVSLQRAKEVSNAVANEEVARVKEYLYDYDFDLEMFDGPVEGTIAKLHELLKQHGRTLHFDVEYDYSGECFMRAWKERPETENEREGRLARERVEEARKAKRKAAAEKRKATMRANKEEAERAELDRLLAKYGGSSCER